MIKEKRDMGMYVTDTAKDMGINRPTVIKYIRSKKLDPYLDYVKSRIDRYNLSAVRILEEIRKNGYNGGYSTLKNYCRTLRKDRAIAALLRFETEPGRQAQVDFGEFGRIDIERKGKKLYAFSYILGYSRYRYVEFTTDITVQNVGLHTFWPVTSITSDPPFSYFFYFQASGHTLT